MMLFYFFQQEIDALILSLSLNLIYVKEVISCSEIKDKSKAKLEILALWGFFFLLHFNLNFVKLLDDLQWKHS